MSIKILVNGAKGKMGKVTVNAINADKALTLVGEADNSDNLAQLIKTTNAQVVVDFTPATVAYKNAKIIIDAGVHPVIGSSGIKAEEIKSLQTECDKKQLGGIIAPNFSIGAVLMMQFAKQAANYLPKAEITEFHHDQKIDAPSGTAIKTAEMIKETNKINDVPIHSVRLPGLFAHQEVIFGNVGETLTIRNDAIDRQAMMPGVILACKKVIELKQLVYGLENLLFHD